jgi:DNA invertase Pin-like site-specific DNA recombinase
MLGMSPSSSLSAVIYCRISNDPTGQAAGVERQERECREFCASRGWDVRDVILDNDLSATSGKARPGFERLLTSSPEVIVVWHTDRLVRLTRDLERVIELGVNVHAVTAGHLDLSTPAGRAVARTVTAWATYEGEQKSLRQKAATDQRVQAGRPQWTRARPFGYRRDTTLHPSEAPLVAKAYDDATNGKPLTHIAEEWNAAGVTTTQGGRWNQASVSALLRSPRNAGILTYRGERKGRGTFPAIVTEETWRAYMRSRPQAIGPGAEGTGRAPANLLTGIARCRHGQPMRVGKAATNAIYKSRDFCTSWRRDWADQAVEALVIARLSCPDLADVFAPPGDTGEREALQREMDELRERLNALAEDFSDGLIDREAYRRGVERGNARMGDMEQRLQAYAHDAALEPFAGAHLREVVEERWEGLDLYRRRAVIEALTESVTLDAPGRGARQLTPALLDKVKIKWKGDDE